MVYEALIRNLEQSCQICQELKVYAEKKKDAVIHNNLDELNRIVYAENKLVQQADALEQERQQLAVKYMQHSGFMPVGQISMSVIIGVTHDAQRKQELMKLQKQLSELVNDLKERNDLNQQLIQQSLDYLQFHLELLVEDGGDAVTYQHPAAAKAKLGYSSFDAKV